MQAETHVSDDGLRFSATALRAIREVRGMSRRGLAEHAGISSATVVAYEIGRCAPSSAALGRLARALGVDVNALYDNGDPLGPWPEVRSTLPPTADAADVADLAGVLHRIDVRHSLGAAS